MTFANRREIDPITGTWGRTKLETFQQQLFVFHDVQRNKENDRIYTY